jgi:aromatic ring-cleaving dioxygenase
MMTATKTKTVILWGGENLLGRAVELFLAARQEWEVIRIVEQDNGESLLQQVERVNPNIVIVYQDNFHSNSSLPLKLLQRRQGLRVIIVSLENNSMEVYNKQKIWVKEISDLISTVEA